jgi:mevalonate kinase
LQVSHPKIDEIVRVSSSLGLHAKLTGAGGGGFAYVLLPPHLKLEIVEQAKDLVRLTQTLINKKSKTILRLKVKRLLSFRRVGLLQIVRFHLNLW